MGGEKLGKDEYWSPNLVMSKKIETMDIDKESGGLLSSLEKKEKSETNEMTSYINLLSRPTSKH